MIDPDSLSEGHLSDWKQERIGIACGPCGRNGDYKLKTLRTLLGNPPMAEVPRFLAVKAGCPLAVRFPGTECRAWFTVPDRHVLQHQVLSARYHEGWSLILRCERSRQGLKSVKPCPHVFQLELKGLVAALGHEFPLDQLGRRLVCPGCGSRQVALSWIPPKSPPAEPIPFKRAG